MDIKNSYQRIKDLVLSLIFPKFCFGCHKFGRNICLNCQRSIRQKLLVCPVCFQGTVGGKTHLICRDNEALDGLWVYGAYEGILAQAIERLKYGWVRSLASELVDLLIIYWVKNQPYFLELIAKEDLNTWLITFVPQENSRQRWRGYNQSQLLASEIAKRIKIRCLPLLQKIRSTKPQVSLTAAKRRQNLKGVFRSLYTKQLTGKSVLLIDDVFTTGSTLKECTKVLKQAGAKRVWGVTLAC